MLMSEFVSQVLNEFRSLPENPAGTHPLVSRESQIEYDKLKNYLLRYVDCNDALEVYVDQIKKLFQTRFNEKRNTLSSYQIHPYSKINYSYVILAKHLAQYTHIPVYNLLMPTVQFDKSFYHFKPNEFILIERDGLIPVSVIDYLDNLMSPAHDGLIVSLTRAERKLITHHSDEARRYTQAILLDENKDVISACREKLASALKSNDYRVTADFGRKGEARLAASILPYINDWRELAGIISGYVPKADWQKCFDLINNGNLFKAMLDIEFNKMDLQSGGIEMRLIELSRNLRKRIQLLETFFSKLKEKELAVSSVARKIPDLLRIVSTFDMADMFAKANYNMDEFKRLLFNKITAKLAKLPAHIFDDQLEVYRGQAELTDVIVQIYLIKRQIKRLKTLNASDFFMLMMSIDIDKCRPDEGEQLLTQAYDTFLMLSFKKNTLKCEYDNFVRTYFFLLSEIYRRQRDFRGDQYLSSVNCKANKMQACELFQHFLLSDYSLHEFCAYPFNDALLDQNDLTAIWTPLSSDTLGELTDNAFKLGAIFYYNDVNTDYQSAQITFDDNEHLNKSYLAEVEGWEKIVKEMLKGMSAGKWKAFINHIDEIDSREQAQKYLIKHALYNACSMDTLMTLLVDYLPQGEWKKVAAEVELITWISAITNLDVKSLKIISREDPLKFRTKFWGDFDIHFQNLLKANEYFPSDRHARAYAFCLALTYKRQREKRGDYSTQLARTASKFKILSGYSGHSKKDKVLACDALIDFIVAEGYEMSEQGLREYLRAHHLHSAQKYSDILKTDTLGEVASKVYKCGVKGVEKNKYYKYRS